jgi:hypothetical protein
MCVNSDEEKDLISRMSITPALTSFQPSFLILASTWSIMTGVMSVAMILALECRDLIAAVTIPGPQALSSIRDEDEMGCVSLTMAIISAATLEGAPIGVRFELLECECDLDLEPELELDFDLDFGFDVPRAILKTVDCGSSNDEDVADFLCDVWIMC